MSKMDKVYISQEDRAKYELDNRIRKYQLPQKIPSPHDDLGIATFSVGQDNWTSLLNTNPVSMFNSIRGNGFSNDSDLPEWAMNITATDISKEDGYQFENESEYVIYRNLYKDNDVSWAPSDEYIDLYKKGYVLVKNRNYLKAIVLLENCIRLNPIAIKARFEKAEALLRLQNIPDIQSRIHKKRLKVLKAFYDPEAFKSAFMKAKNEMIQMSGYFYDNLDIARFYRKLGFIETGFLNYETAMACYSYSLNFEEHYSVERELRYIAELSKEARPLGRKPSLSNKPEEYLYKAKIPVLQPTIMIS